MSSEQEKATVSSHLTNQPAFRNASASKSNIFNELRAGISRRLRVPGYFVPSEQPPFSPRVLD